MHTFTYKLQSDNLTRTLTNVLNVVYHNGQISICYTRDGRVHNAVFNIDKLNFYTI